MLQIRTDYQDLLIQDKNCSFYLVCYNKQLANEADCCKIWGSIKNYAILSIFFAG